MNLRRLPSAGVLPVLFFLFPAAADAQSRFTVRDREMAVQLEDLHRLRQELASLLVELEKLQPTYEDIGKLKETHLKRDSILREVAPRLDQFGKTEQAYNNARTTAELQKVTIGIQAAIETGSLPDDAPAEFAQAEKGLQFSQETAQFREHLQQRLREDEAKFRQARMLADRAHTQKIILVVAFTGFLILGLIVALFYQTRKVQTTQMARLMTSTGGPALAHVTAGPSGGVPSLPGPAAGPVNLNPGDLLDGNYRIERELGRGGMGIVYEATDVTLNRKVAIKRMLREISDSPDELELFLSEARMVASLKHPNLVEIYAILREGGNIYLIFEHIDGHPLSRYLEGRRRLSIRSAKQTVRQVASALDYAHSKKLIHRDLKPANIMISSEGVAKVMDFGIAYQAKMTVAKTTRANPWGTPAYMAPEQELGKISRESDLFALGVCLYEILTGNIPFRGPNFLAQKQQAIYDPPTLTTPALPKLADALLTRALHPDAAQRFHTAGEMARHLDSLPDDPPADRA